MWAKPPLIIKAQKQEKQFLGILKNDFMYDDDIRNRISSFIQYI